MSHTYRIVGLLVLIGIFALFFHPASYLYEKVDRAAEFSTNFGGVFAAGEFIRTHAKAGDTLFVDGHDDLVLWQAKLPNPYPYGWYTSFMPRFSVYTNARQEMFRLHPPTWYYGICDDDTKEPEIPGFIRDSYVRSITDGSCIFHLEKQYADVFDKNR